MWSHRRSVLALIGYCLFAVMSCSLWAEDGPLDWITASELSPGVWHLRIETESPRKIVAHCLRIDTQTPGIKFQTTPRRMAWELGKAETTRQTVRNFIRSSRQSQRKLIAAVNGDAFSPWPAPYDREEPTDLTGLAITDGVVVSKPSGTPSLLIMKNGELRISTVSPDEDLTGIETAISGFAMCLVDGVAPVSGEDLHPRTAYGLSEDRRMLYLLTIDGRQPQSVGATVQEAGQLLKRCGAQNGINMDGGGSTTMAWWNPTATGDDKCQLLNSPVGRGRFGAGEASAGPTERANGNNFGVYYVPP